MTSSDDDRTRADEPVYSYQPSVLGAPRSFRLTRYALEWEAGRRSGRVRFDRITRVRMSFRPATLQTQRFITEVWSADAPKLDIVSCSWKSMVEQVNFADDYRVFVSELHARMAGEGTTARFDAGINPLIYWLGLALFVAAALGMSGLTAQALAAGATFGGLVIAAFLLLFLWQLGNIFYRNRPGSYRLDALPPKLLPSATR
jgi:hypothetical protein